MNNSPSFAPGWPGIEPRWTSSAKTGIGTALNRNSRVWFSLSHGIVNEVYYPRVDQASTRDMGLMVTGPDQFFSEEKRHTSTETSCPIDGVPAYRLVNTCDRGRYRIDKEILTDPRRNVLLQRTRFTPLEGTPSQYQLYVLLAPHLANRGRNNTAWVGEHEGRPMLFARRDRCALALACSLEWLARSAGFVGASDGWQDANAHRTMAWQYDRAENGNIALTGQIAIPDDTSDFVLALGFGPDPDQAARNAASSLDHGFDSARDQFVQEWRQWHESRSTTEHPKDSPTSLEDNPPSLESISAVVIRTCESKAHPGGIVASLSIPWGSSRTDDDLGGYHLIWPRDLVETAESLLAIGAQDEARSVLDFLRTTQADDGHWPQNMWADGTPFWNGIQLDETALPILLSDLMWRTAALTPLQREQHWPMVRRAAAFLVTNGPVTIQDRWEEDPGYSPFTLAATIAALLAAADCADAHADPNAAAYLRDTADIWNDSVERWTYVTDTELARHVGVDGYYVRIAPPDVADAASPISGFVPIKNRPPAHSRAPAAHLISPDALALVRFGLRAPDDPRIVNTVKAIDALLKIDTPRGPAWHRYNSDGYGEHADGAPFDGVGIGRAWPLLSGERAHYELAAGRPNNARRLLHTIEAFANQGGMIPEQIWDAPDIPARDLYLARPSGSAMPLIWAHAEYLKLSRSLRDKSVFDLPPQCVERYLNTTNPSHRACWRFNHRLRTLPQGKTLRIEVLDPAVVRWTADDWQTSADTHTEDTTLGMHVADLQTSRLDAGKTIRFTFRWPQADRWEGTDFNLTVQPTRTPANA